MAGYWPSSFFACLWTETKSRSTNSQKENKANPSHLNRTNLVNKGFIIWLLVKFCLQDTAGSLERAKWLYLSRSGSQLQRAIRVIMPAGGASRIIKLSFFIPSWLLVLCLLCIFSRLRKYLVFLSPSLYQRLCDLKIAPFVR